MSSTYDAIIIGLGAMGSATAYQLARRGVRVLGLERFTPAHSRGSSHGHSRIIRQAYMEDPAYVPLLLRAYELWEEIERESGQALLTLTGGLMLGAPDSQAVAGAARSAEEHGLPYELLDAADLRQRFPPLRPEPGTVALYEHRAGFVRPEASIGAFLGRAAALGAELRFEEPALCWEAGERGVRVTTARGTYEAGRLVVAGGAWAPELLGELGAPLHARRKVLFWFTPTGGVEPFLPDRFPIYIWELSPELSFYGFPHQEGAPGGIKVALHSGGEPCTPETIDRTVRPEDVTAIREAVGERIPALQGPLLEAATCMYTMTPDEHFVVGMHPSRPNVVVASPCSGHGFKFTSVMGEVLADLAQTGETRHPIRLFSPLRFSATT
jgi:sarcosine oxidase